MELVQFSNNGGVVSFRVTVNGKLAWRYVYVADNYKFSKTDRDTPPYEHAVGLPSEINNEINTWEFQLGNLTNADVAYTLQIDWVQSGNVIHTWSRNGVVTAAEKAKVVKDSAMLVGI